MNEILKEMWRDWKRGIEGILIVVFCLALILGPMALALKYSYWYLLIYLIYGPMVLGNL